MRADTQGCPITCTVHQSPFSKDKGLQGAMMLDLVEQAEVDKECGLQWFRACESSHQVATAATTAKASSPFFMDAAGRRVFLPGSFR